jgi:hypothetical protein
VRNFSELLLDETRKAFPVAPRGGFRAERLEVIADDAVSILNFAERVLPRAADLWIQASLEQRQRLQRLFFPEGVAFSGKSFDRTVVTSSLFEYLRPLDRPQENWWTRPGSNR